MFWKAPEAPSITAPDMAEPEPEVELPLEGVRYNPAGRGIPTLAFAPKSEDPIRSKRVVVRVLFICFE
jgi:hypothetical protein